MASVPFVIERRIQYHGMWNAGYNIGELFFRNISREFAKKAPYPAVMRLSVGAMTLTVFRRGSSLSEPIRTDAIPFEALRDITVNPFNSRCLMVIYVNNKNKFSVLVSSCRNTAETKDITSAFQKLRALRQASVAKASQNKDSNWIIRKNDSSDGNGNTDQTDGPKSNGTDNAIINNNNNNNEDNGLDNMATANGNSSPNNESDITSIKSRTDSRVLADNFEFLDQHDISFDDGAVFDDDTDGFSMEEGPGENTASVGLQTNIQDRSDRMSVNSESSFVSFQDLKDEIDSISQETPVAEEEYLKKQTDKQAGEQTDKQTGEQTDSIVANGIDHALDQVDGKDKDDITQTNGISETDAILEVIKVGETEDYDFRSVGIQTEPVTGGGRIRYTKRPGSMGTSNMYKALAEQRKHKHITDSNGGPSTNGVVAKQRPVSYHVTNGVRGGRAHSVYVTRPVTVSASSTTVTKPIEHVYSSHSWSRRGLGHSRKRRVMVMSAGRHTVRI